LILPAFVWWGVASAAAGTGLAPSELLLQKWENYNLTMRGIQHQAVEATKRAVAKLAEGRCIDALELVTMALQGLLKLGNKGNIAMFYKNYPHKPTAIFHLARLCRDSQVESVRRVVARLSDNKALNAAVGGAFCFRFRPFAQWQHTRDCYRIVIPGPNFLWAMLMGMAVEW
jgi:hypothetical protein